mmetsp:Transcript_76529/g.177600  ORF Transcript_76529/g.177600 Transcript_76529/m.177600 type:complete len:101 (+) Transcript_76529:512-814(+)
MTRRSPLWTSRRMAHALPQLPSMAQPGSGTRACVLALRGHEDGLTSVVFQPRDGVVPVPISAQVDTDKDGDAIDTLPEVLQPKNHHQDYMKDPAKWLDEL